MAVATLKEFEEALRAQGMRQALAILDKLRERDRRTRKVAPARRIAGVKMTPDLALRILDLHKTTSMTQQEIAFELGVNQGRVNEVIKHGKWLSDDEGAPERARARQGAGPDAQAVGEGRGSGARTGSQAQGQAAAEVQPAALSALIDSRTAPGATQGRPRSRAGNHLDGSHLYKPGPARL
jgi:hypothetical protein